ncbi:suppressor of fused domain protein [Corynebacterium sp. Q4381]|uniref:suppressor of fused domain protein n=1 Tax=Corynebacterium sp. Marseille-Q4381 TaxID=3121597 RepID=UPI002FE5AC70
MGWLSAFAARVRQGPPLGGDAVLKRVAEAAAAVDPFVFTFDDLDGLDVLAFRVDEPFPHYLYVTFGLSRVRSSVPVAGTQTELTMRVAADSPVPYAWPAERLAGMVAQVRRTGSEIAPGHHMVTADGGFTFVVDPVLTLADAPTGIIRFTYAVGVTARELDAALSWDPAKFTGVLGDYVPLGLTDPARGDIMDIDEARARVEAGMADEGSSISAMQATHLVIDPCGHIEIDQRSAQALLRAARFRLRFGRTFALVNRDAALLLIDAPFNLSPAHAEIPATPAFAAELIAVLDVEPATYRLRSVPIEIEVVETP